MSSSITLPIIFWDRLSPWTWSTPIYLVFTLQVLGSVTVPPTSAFLWVLRAEVRSSCLCGKYWAISPASPASFDPGRTTALTCLELGHPRNQLWTKNILYLTSHCMLGLDLLLFLPNSRSSDRLVLWSKAPVFMPALQVKNLACLSLYPVSQAAGD